MLLISKGHAQCTKGDKAFELLQYQVAIQEYTKCLKKKENASYLLERMGDCYYALGNTAMAVTHYKNLLEIDSKNNTVQIKYANALLRNGNQDDYNQYLGVLMAMYPENIAIQQMKYAMNSSMEDHTYEVGLAPFNSASADFSPAFLGHSLVFSSSRNNGKQQDKFTGDNFTDLYVFDTLTSSVEPLKTDFSAKYNLGAAVFSTDGKTMYFSSNIPIKASKSTAFVQIYKSTLHQGIWSEAQLFSHNFVDANSMHPAINPKGDVFVFSSDNEVLYRMDLYYCTRKNATSWSQPMLLPDHINTKKGNEVFPTFINDSTLIFSSDGLGHLGFGLDLYKTIWNGKQWSRPQRLDDPLNSYGDDFGLISKDDLQSGYFTSNRDDYTGHESIYSFHRVVVEVPKQEAENRVPILIVAGAVKGDGQPLPYARISIAEASGPVIQEIDADSLGRFDIQLSHYPELKIHVSALGYQDEQRQVWIGSISDTARISLAFDLIPVADDEAMVLNNIYYDFDSWDILPEATKELDKLLSFLIEHPTIHVELSSHTDARGNDRYNQILSQKRADAARQYLLKQGIEAVRIQAVGYGESRLMNHCSNGIQCSEEEHAQNRRTEIRIIRL